MSLLPATKVGKLQEALHAKAKRAPTYRFYALDDKVYRGDVLWHAYQCCRANAGAAGVDGQTFEDIEAYGTMKWLGELADACHRLRQWLAGKYKVRGWRGSRFSDQYLHETLGLIRLRRQPPGSSCAPA
jgi:hypothetical protein